MKILFIGICLILSGCTYSINMVHSSGSASDIIDENQKADADVKASIPAAL